MSQATDFVSIVGRLACVLGKIQTIGDSLYVQTGIQVMETSNSIKCLPYADVTYAYNTTTVIIIITS